MSLRETVFISGLVSVATVETLGVQKQQQNVKRKGVGYRDGGREGGIVLSSVTCISHVLVLCLGNPPWYNHTG